MKMPTYTVYAIVHKTTGQTYIGLTGTKLKVRWRAHVSKALNHSRGSPIERAIREHGPDQFELKVLETAETYEQGVKRENHWIRELKKEPRKNHYNLIVNGGGRGINAAGPKKHKFGPQAQARL